VVKFDAGDISNTVNGFVTSKVITFTGGESMLIDADINFDGILNYTVKSLGAVNQEFWFDAAYASVDAHQIPDGGSTVLVLGLAVMSFEGVRRSVKRA
jgi:hypothetical protein